MIGNTYKKAKDRQLLTLDQEPFEALEVFLLLFLLDLLDNDMERHLNVKEAPYLLGNPLEQELIVHHNQQ